MLSRGADLSDLAVADEDVVRAVEVCARVEHVCAADERIGGRRGRADQGVLGLGPHASCASGVRSGAVRPESTS